ncbi:MAG: hypothetical protein IJ390_12795 [Lachnospiraceae bacterium]|nr:hypothetical protein [Lachnospiraceae bacterium]
MVIFGAIFVYISICVWLYFFDSKHIEPYTVKMGSLSQENLFTGIALRTETVVNSDYSGYINYYAREGERLGSGQLVCTIDESGQLREMINEQNADNTALSETDLRELKTGISSYCSGFETGSFESVYDFKYNLEGTVLKLANINVLENLSEINESVSGQPINLCRTPASGIIVYSVDGYEGKTAEDITTADFSQENYEKNQLISNELVTAQDPLYKLSTEENWSIIIEVDRSKAAELEEEEYVKVRFLSNQYESWGQVTILDKGKDGVFARLDFNNSMITFVTERFIDIELITDAESGLKVPNSAITSKEFFLVPKAYVTKGGNSGQTGVLRQVAGENGALTTEFVATQIYEETQEDYYLDNSALRVGDHLIMPDSNEEYTVSKSASLIGVYNINKGYADFKEVQILQQNDEYAIIKSNTTYGLSVYDHIVLDAETVDPNEMIYE